MYVYIVPAGLKGRVWVDYLYYAGSDQDFHMNQQVPLEFRVLNTENLGRNILGVDTMPYWIFAL